MSPKVWRRRLDRNLRKHTTTDVVFKGRVSSRLLESSARTLPKLEPTISRRKI